MGVFTDEFLKGFKPRSKLTGSAWADQYRYVAPGTSPEPGEWRTERVPYLREPMDAATDKKTEMVVLCCSSQIGKSEALLNIMGFFVDQDPAPQLMLQPTIEAAENFSKERIEPTFKYSPGLKDKLEEGKDGRGTAKKSSTTIRMKHYPGGYLAMVGANSPAGLASRPIRVLLCDEIDRYGTTKEGDPLELAIQRTSNFHNKKIVMVSTPTIKGRKNGIEDWFLKGDQRLFYIPCPHCGHEHPLKWENVKWDKDESGAVLPFSARQICPKCAGVIRGAYKPDPKLIGAGKWKATAKAIKPGIKSYHVSALYSPWVNLHELVAQFAEITKDRNKNGLMEFINLKLGESWDESSIGDDIWDRLYRRREYYPPDELQLPAGVLVLTAGVDVQRNRLECTVYGWGMGKECWAIAHRIIYGAPDEMQVWQDLDSFLQTGWALSNGARLPLACVCVDSGDGMFSANVYRYTKQRERMRVFSVKGRGGVGIPFVNPPTKSNSENAMLFTLGVDAGKALLMGRLTIDEEGPGFVHFPRQEERGFTEEFFQQLTSEVFEQRLEKGIVKRGWKKLRERNEALDCAVYATAALELINPNFEQLAAFYSGQSRVNAPAAPRKRRPNSRGITF